MLKKVSELGIVLTVLFCLTGAPCLTAQESAKTAAKEPVSIIPMPRNTAWWHKRHQEKVNRMEQGNVDLLFVGDSITHNWEAFGKRIWAQYYDSRNALNIGFSGDRTEHVIWRLMNSPTDKISPKLVVLMIGTNNIGAGATPEDTVLGIKKTVSTLKEKFPTAKIILLEVFPRGEKPDNPLRLKVNKVNKGIRKELANIENVRIMSFEKLYLQKDGILPKALMKDFLHPGEEGYVIWAEQLEPIVSSLCGPLPVVRKTDKTAPKAAPAPGKKLAP